MSDEIIKENPENPENPHKMEPNTKPAISMRVAGGIIDIGLVFMATFGLHTLITATPMGNVLNDYRIQMINVQDEYKLLTLVEGSEETYGHKAYEGSEEYTTYSSFVKHEDELGTYIVVDNAEISQDVIKAFNSALSNNQTHKTASFNYRFTNFGYLCLASGVAEILLIFVLPLVNKNKATLGRMFAGTRLVHKEYGTPPRWYQLLGRLLFIYAFETVVPYLIISNIVAVMIAPLIFFIIALFNKQNRTLTDYVTRTLLIDKRSYSPITQRRGVRL